MASLYKEGIYKNFSPHDLFYRYWRIAESKAQCVIIHGLGEHSGRYHDLAKALNQGGYSVFSFDLIGHGKSSGQRGYIKSFSEYISEVDHFLEYARKISYSEKTFLISHSLGSLIALHYLTRHPQNALNGAIISAIPLFARNEIPGYKKVAACALSPVFPRISVVDQFIKPEMLSSDPDEIKKLENDKYYHKFRTARFVSEYIKFEKQAYSLAPSVKLPVLFMQGSLDQIALAKHLPSFTERIGSEDIACAVYEGYRHEVFNEKGRAVCYQEALQWLDSH